MFRRRFINGPIFKTQQLRCNVTTQKIATLAAALKADILSTDRPSTPSSSIDCFLCGRSYTYKGPNGDDSGRFCSDKCREAYDRGLAAYDPGYALKDNPRWYNVPIGPKGFFINCASCGNRFDSMGLRCCSPECERRLCEHDENTTLMAGVGIEVEPRRKCAASGCSNPVPKWRNGRRVSKRARFCDRHSRHSRKNGHRKR
jgi:hypothetical protein